MTEKDIKRFWDKVQKPTECWEWKDTKPGKYGGMAINKVNKGAHRISYEIHFGEIPKGLMVCHKCDNPRCVNPDHLFLGTAKDNYQDAVKKGRMRYRKKPKEPLRRDTYIYFEVAKRLRNIMNRGKKAESDVANVLELPKSIIRLFLKASVSHDIPQTRISEKNFRKIWLHVQFLETARRARKNLTPSIIKYHKMSFSKCHCGRADEFQDATYGKNIRLCTVKAPKAGDKESTQGKCTVCGLVLTIKATPEQAAKM